LNAQEDISAWEAVVERTLDMIFVMFFFSICRGMISILIKINQSRYLFRLKDSFIFLFVSSLFQIVFLFLMPPYKKLDFRPELLVYGFAFAVFYLGAFALLIKAISIGKTGLTNIIYSFNFFVPVIAGVFFWDEGISLFQVFSMLLFGVSMFLFNFTEIRQGRENREGILKWMVLCIAASVTIGVAGTVSKQYAMDFEGLYKEYLILYNFFVLVITLPVMFSYKRSSFAEPKGNGKFFLITAAIALLQNTTNIIFMFYVNRYAAASFFPILNLLSIMSTVILSAVILKEKNTLPAKIGILTSLLAIVVVALE